MTRAKLFGKNYSTNNIKKYQKEKYKNINFINIDIINKNKIENLFKKINSI